MTTDYFATKYSSAAEEVIALLADETEGYGQRDDTSGNVDYIGGCFALVTIPEDVYLIPDGPIASARYGADSVAAEYGVLPADVVGTFIVTHDSQGFVTVERFEDPQEARDEFECRAARFAEWDDEERDEDGDGMYVCPVAGHGYHSL